MILESVKVLEEKYASKMENGFQDNEFHMSTRMCDDGIYDWFPMVQRFTRSFLSKLFGKSELKDSRIVLDPFMGSGNVLLACLEYGKIGYGIDISPMFCFTAHVKTNKYTKKDFEEAIDLIKSKEKKGKKVKHPALTSFQRFFDDEILGEILRLKEATCVLNQKAKELVHFALISELLTFSNAERDGKGLHKKRKEKTSDIYRTIAGKLRKMREENEQFRKLVPHAVETYSLCGDARDFESIINPYEEGKTFPTGEIDNIVTSPPYCNSADYIEMYKLEHWFLDFVKSYDEFRALSYSTVRSHTTFSNEKVDWRHEVIDDLCPRLEGLWGKKMKIPNMIRGYFDDLHIFFEQVQRVLRPGGTIFMVVGNSCYKGMPIPTDLLLAEAAKDTGLYVERINLLRRIMTSGQQWKTLSSEDKAILRESLLVLKRSERRARNVKLT